jgi:hypothetical protein
MRTRTPSPTRRRRTRSRSRSTSRSRSPPGSRSRSRTPEGKRRTIFSIFESDPQTEAQEEAEYLEKAKPGDLLIFSGNNQMNTWRKICKKENGVKKWERLPDDDEDYYGGKRRRKTMRKKRKRTRKCH